MKPHERTTTQVCKCCNVEKDINEFQSCFSKARNRTNIRLTCKACYNAKQKIAKAAPERVEKEKLRRQNSDVKERMKESRLKFEAKVGKEYYAERRAKPEYKAAMKEYQAARRTTEEGKKKLKEYHLERYSKQEVKDKCAEQRRNWFLNNPDAFVEYSAARRRLIAGQKPAWYDSKEVLKLRKEARELTVSTGVKHHVDHIVPLKNSLVTGLHWHGNMRITTALDNLSKSNKLVDDIVYS